jgi:hypothetical protein
VLANDRSRLKKAAKRSRSAVIAATLVKNQLARLEASRAIPASTSGSTHESFDRAESLAYIDSVFDDYLSFGMLECPDLAGKSVLELGPGDNLGVALRFLACGARRVVAVDRFKTIRNEAQHAQIYRALVQSLDEEARRRLEGVIDWRGGVRFDDSRLRWLEGLAIEGAAQALEPASFDLIVSRAVLEHVAHLYAAFAAMDSLLASGGLMLHEIDFRDHGMFTDGGQHPLTFLTVGDRLYSAMSADSGRPNRRLLNWYRRELRRRGYHTRISVTRVHGSGESRRDPAVGELESVDRPTRELISAIRPRLRPQFRELSDTDLAAANAYVVARKP